MARYATGAQKAALYIAVMLPLWSIYLVRLYAWKLLLAKEGAISWAANTLGLQWLLDALLTLPAVGGPSLSFSTLGTFIVFVYMWLPFMVLPIMAAVERIPSSTIEASSDLGASPAQTLRRVILPLAMPGIAAGSIFTVRGRVFARPDRRHRDLSLDRQAAGGLRCALIEPPGA
jgi:putative spermidine/putrescine transport system permease protein